jgi:hypothetical protein
MYDFNGDGLDDILYWSSSKTKNNQRNAGQFFYIYSFKDSQYQLMLEANINELMTDANIPNIESDTFSLRNGYAVGDFYGNGKNYIALTTAKNNYLFIIEILDFRAKIIDWIKLDHPYRNISRNKTPIVSADLDNDGKKEIIYLHYGKINDVSGTLGKTEMWTYQVFKLNENNKYEKVFEDDIWGVQLDSPIRNTINAGNVDNIDGDEVVISVFPNLYVLKWNKENNTLVPIWYYPSSNSNAIVISDFDNNGKKEIAFTSFNATEFYEFSSDYKVGSDIAYFNGWATSTTTAHFQWINNLASTSATDAEFVLEIYLSSDINTSAEPSPIKTINISANSNENIFIYDVAGLQSNIQYTAFIYFKNISSTNVYYSAPVRFTTNANTAPLNAAAINNHNILLRYSEKLAMNVEPGAFILINAEHNSSFIPITSISNYLDSSVILEFANNIPNGNYKLLAAPILDYYNNHTIADTINCIVNIANEQTELFLTSLNFIPPNSLSISFSEPIDETALINSNYTLSPFGQIANITMQDDNRINIFLEHNYIFDGRGKNYFITAANISAISGNMMTTGAGNTLAWTIAANALDNVYIYPNPINLNSHNNAFIGHLTKHSNIKILTINGNLIRTLEENDGNGGVEWNLRDDNGNLLDIGVYLIHCIDLTDVNKTEKYIKFAIIRP